MIDFQPGQRVESTVAGDTFGRFGTVNKQQAPDRVYVRWDGNILATGYRLDGRVAQGLRVHPSATTISVAQAVSFAIDEVREFGDSDGRMGLPLDRDAEEAPETALRITEVSAQLENAANGLTSIFQVTTSDGQIWDVKITPGRN
jgi:hypothetical protein